MNSEEFNGKYNQEPLLLIYIFMNLLNVSMLFVSDNREQVPDVHVQLRQIRENIMTDWLMFWWSSFC